MAQYHIRTLEEAGLDKPLVALGKIRTATGQGLSEQTMAQSDYKKLHAAVSEAGTTLKELHRELVELTKGHYEKKFGRVNSPGELLRLLLNAPEFAWLHAMSELMVDIDELLAHPEISPVDAAAVRSEISKLVAPPELDSSDFYRKYKDALQSPEVVVSHGKLRKVLAELPEPEPEDIAEVMRARHKWAEKNRQRTRRVQ